jgi:hypothetical protein
MNNIDLSEKFQQYFHEPEGFGSRSERFYDSMEAFSNKPALAASMKLWLEAAFIQGAKAMAQDTVYTLRDYAAAVAGVDEVCYNGTQAFDASADYLITYYTEILQDAEK